MTYVDFLVSQALMSSRGTKAQYQRRSKRSSERQQKRAIERRSQAQRPQE